MPRKARSTSQADQHTAPGGAASVDRALTLLAAFRSGDQTLSLAELASRTQLYKSTALRLLASLEHAKLLCKQPDGRYSLGSGIARLHAIYASAFSIEHVVMPVLQALVQLTGESAAFHVRQGHGTDWTRLCLYRVDSPHAVRDHARPGDLLPADRGAGARILCAYSDGAMPTPTPEDKALYATIRTQGYYAQVGDRSPELAGISAPVWHADGRLAGALTLTMPTHRYNPAAIAPVREAAQQLSLQLGYNP